MVTRRPRASGLPSIPREGNICLGHGDPDDLFQQTIVGMAGLEPATSPSRTVRAHYCATSRKATRGTDRRAPGGTRTRDVLLRRQALCPLSYGRAWSRTGSNRRALGFNQVLCRLSYRTEAPTRGTEYRIPGSNR